MSIEDAIFDILSKTAGVTAIVAKRIYPLGIPEGKSVPAIVYQQITSTVPVTCDGDGTLRTDRVQITCWDDDPDGARTLSEAVRTAMQAASGSHGSVTITYCSIEDEGDAFNLDENESLTRYGKRQDWEIAYQP